MRLPQARFLSALLLTAVLCGCAGSARYARFAEAGKAYAASLDRALVVTAETSIDATSEKLLQEDDLANLDKVEAYRKLSNVDEERVVITGRLRKHAALLARYFELLHRLAESGAPEETKAAIEETVERLNTLGEQLRGSPLLSSGSGIASGGSAVMGFLVRGALRREFIARRAAIERELRTQEELLNILSSGAEQDLSVIRANREMRDVIQPLTDERVIQDAQGWIETRRRILASPRTVAELEEAKAACMRLREAFEDLARGQMSEARLKTLVRPDGGQGSRQP